MTTVGYQMWRRCSSDQLFCLSSVRLGGGAKCHLWIEYFIFQLRCNFVKLHKKCENITELCLFRINKMLARHMNLACSPKMLKKVIYHRYQCYFHHRMLWFLAETLFAMVNVSSTWDQCGSNNVLFFFQGLAFQILCKSKYSSNKQQIVHQHMQNWQH